MDHHNCEAISDHGYEVTEITNHPEVANEIMNGGHVKSITDHHDVAMPLTGDGGQDTNTTDHPELGIIKETNDNAVQPTSIADLYECDTQDEAGPDQVKVVMGNGSGNFGETYHIDQEFEQERTIVELCYERVAESDTHLPTSSPEKHENATERETIQVDDQSPALDTIQTISRHDITTAELSPRTRTQEENVNSLTAAATTDMPGTGDEMLQQRVLSEHVPYLFIPLLADVAAVAELSSTSDLNKVASVQEKVWENATEILVGSNKCESLESSMQPPPSSGEITTLNSLLSDEAMHETWATYGALTVFASFALMAIEGTTISSLWIWGSILLSTALMFVFDV